MYFDNDMDDVFLSAGESRAREAKRRLDNEDRAQAELDEEWDNWCKEQVENMSIERFQELISSEIEMDMLKEEMERANKIIENLQKKISIMK